MAEQTSRSLLDRLRANSSTNDWEVFHSIYRPLIARQLRVRRVAIAEIDDLTQEILTKVFVGIGSFSHNGRSGSFRKWLSTIISHHVWSYFQKLNRVPTTVTLAEFSMATADGELDAQFQAEHDQHVLENMLRLIQPEFTETTWSAFEYQVLHGQTAACVAEALSITSNAALIAKSRVLSRLRQLGAGLVEHF